MKNINGKIIHGEEEVSNRCEEYFEQIPNTVIQCSKRYKTSEVIQDNNWSIIYFKTGRNNKLCVLLEFPGIKGRYLHIYTRPQGAM